MNETLQMMDELTAHYKKFAEICRNGDFFARIGRDLIQRYPSIEREGKHPWGALTRQLSARIRQHRCEEQNAHCRCTPEKKCECMHMYRPSIFLITGTQKRKKRCCTVPRGRKCPWRKPAKSCHRGARSADGWTMCTAH